ncbi:MAG: hypothetical protein AAFR89_11445 [Cyanobacteria bacterium J06633_1]
MSALRQPEFDPNYYYSSAPQQEVVNQPKNVTQSPAKKAKIVKSKAFPHANTLPNKLKTLSLLQKGSFGLAIATMTASISLYASTVKIPQQWSQEYHHLEDLQLQERQLIAINETIKYQIAQEASQDDRLAISAPDSAIFIRPAKVRAKQKTPADPVKQKTLELKHNSWGY